MGFVGASVVSYFLTPYVMSYLVHGNGGLTGLVFLSPAEAFFSRFKLALGMGLILGLPVILYQLWALFVPAMTRRQKWISLLTLPAAYGLFLGGCLFALVWVLPLALRFFLSFGGENLQQEISIASYVSFLIGFVLPFGAVFELPVVIVFLARIGVLRPKMLSKNRKYAVLVIFIVSAVMTPADVFSQLMLAGPLLVLYEVSLALARMVAPKTVERPGWRRDWWGDAEEGAVEESTRGE